MTGAKNVIPSSYLLIRTAEKLSVYKMLSTLISKKQNFKHKPEQTMSNTFNSFIKGKRIYHNAFSPRGEHIN